MTEDPYQLTNIAQEPEGMAKAAVLTSRLDALGNATGDDLRAVEMGEVAV
jgi:hypothetical protein